MKQDTGRANGGENRSNRVEWSGRASLRIDTEQTFKEVKATSQGKVLIWECDKHTGVVMTPQRPVWSGQKKGGTW